MDSNFGHLEQLLAKMPLDQIANLRQLIGARLSSGDEDNGRIIKFVYVDASPPRVVVWESHLLVHGLDVTDDPDRSPSVLQLQRSLADKLPQDMRGAGIKLYFASADLQLPRAGQEHLRRFLAVYYDKVYAVFKPSQSELPQSLYAQYSYFNEVRLAVQQQPTLYATICRSLRSLYANHQSPGDADRVYQHLVLLRSLPEVLATVCQDAADAASKAGSAEETVGAYREVAASVDELLTLLRQFEVDRTEAENANVIFGILSALEWLAYLAPRMYGTQSVSTKQLYRRLVDQLLNYALSQDYPLAIRLEAAWALGWASVSSIPVAAYVQEVLPHRRIRKLQSIVLKHVLGGAALRAAFTLASFGPARVTAGAEKVIPVGGFYPEVSDATTSVYSDALQAASDVVYDQLSRFTQMNGDHWLRMLRVTSILAALWIATSITVDVISSPSLSLVVQGLLVGVPGVLLVSSAGTLLAIYVRRLLAGLRQMFGKSYKPIYALIALIVAFLTALSGVVAAFQYIDAFVASVIEYIRGLLH